MRRVVQVGQLAGLELSSSSGLIDVTLIITVDPVSFATLRFALRIAAEMSPEAWKFTAQCTVSCRHKVVRAVLRCLRGELSRQAEIAA